MVEAAGVEPDAALRAARVYDDPGVDLGSSCFIGITFAL